MMGMQASIALADVAARSQDIAAVFVLLAALDRRFSPFRDDSELCRLNRGEISAGDLSDEMREILALAEKTRRDTNGFFNIRRPDGAHDPSGIVKGWAIRKGAQLLSQLGNENFAIEVGGDIQTSGHNGSGSEWRVGIQNPFAAGQTVKILHVEDGGVATSGNYFQGPHIYNPHAAGESLEDIVSLTVVGPDIFEADRYATAAFAMGRHGIGFIESVPGLDGYEIDSSGMARMTSGLAQYLRC